MPQKSGGLLKKFWIPLFIFVILVITFYKTVDHLPQLFSWITNFLGIISPFIGGVAVAFLLYRPAHGIENFIRKSKYKFISSRARGLSVLICYLALFIILAVALYLIIPGFIKNAVSLVQHLPGYFSAAIEYITSLADEEGKIFGITVSELLKNFSVDRILEYFDLNSIGKYAGDVINMTGSISGTVLDVVMAFIVSVYVLLSRSHLVKVATKLLSMVIPREKVKGLYNYIVRTSEIFYSYVYSQLIDAVIVTVICFIVFSIIGLPYSFLLAILMGLCNVIPYFGALIGGVGVTAVTLFSSGDILKTVIALVAVIVVQQLDSNLIQPRIVADSVGLRPVYVLLAIMIGSGLFGFVGMLICVPVMAVIRMIIVDYIKHLGGKDTPLVQKQKELSAEAEKEK